MVGAQSLAEFAWAIENLLNRLLDGTLPRTPAVSGTLREAVAVVPQLVEQLAGGPPPAVDAAALAARAHVLAAGQPAESDTQLVTSTVSSTVTADMAPEPAAAQLVETADAAASPAVDVPATEAVASDGGANDTPAISAAIAPTPVALNDALDAELVESTDIEDSQPVEHIELASEPADAEPVDSGQSDDATLRDIYLRETDTHATVVRQFIAEQRLQTEPHELTEAVYRACHTLSGSSKMAEARHGIRLAEPLDRWLRKSWGASIGLAHADLDLLADCMHAMEQVARHPDESTQFFVQHDRLRERIAAADADLDRRIAEAAEADNIELATVNEPGPEFVAEAAPVAAAPAHAAEPVD